MEKQLHAEFGAATHKGMVRAQNQDSILVDEQYGLAIIADGMGGHNSGDLASKIATKQVSEFVAASFPGETGGSGLKPETCLLHDAVLHANGVILSEAGLTPEHKGMGTTLSAAIIREGMASIAHIGDSRIYLLRDKQLRQITQDHSLVMEQVRKGLMTKEEAETSRMQNILTRALGLHKTVDIDAEEIQLNDGDSLLLCSDGLFKVLSEADLRDIMSSMATPQEIANKMISAANANGAPDNVSVVVIQLSTGTFVNSLKNFARRLFSK